MALREWKARKIVSSAAADHKFAGTIEVVLVSCHSEDSELAAINDSLEGTKRTTRALMRVGAWCATQ
jgi:hypothetical protein